MHTPVRPSGALHASYMVMVADPSISLLICRAALLTAAVVGLPHAATAELGKPELTAQTQKSGGAPNPEQMRQRLDSVDLAIEVMPETETISGVATLGFTARAPV